ncbi:MAG: molecular chaperone HtpG [Myxococcales bacterium]|nr:molecular chaperone HtpG [Myxococcales bacterium]MCB9523229.1 molecular chaperone HtpG [Myxococcales bacterium]
MRAAGPEGQPPTKRKGGPGVAAEAYEFKSEAQQLLDLMIHSIYSNKEIFLRELVSNASDALDKLRFERLTDESLRTDAALKIRVWADAEARTLTVEDNGIGMSRDEVIQNLGTIAHSGTKQFASKLKAAQDSDNAERLIGQFGVGFYSSFMVADEVTVVTRKAGEEGATRWHSAGGGTFDIDTAEREGHGTTVTLHLRPVDEENGLVDFTAEWSLRGIIKKYNDFVTYPVELRTERTELERDDEGKPIEGAEPNTVVEWTVVNSQKAIWTRDPKDVSEEEYAEFYKHIAHDWEAPFETIALKAEGLFEYRALLFIPQRAPFDLFYRDQKYGLQLYVNKVLIEERNEDLVPDWLRFVKGVVDSPDLSLNVSREMLQQDRRVKAIRKKVVRKVLDTLETLLKDDREKYLKFWGQFGRVLKEGATDRDFQAKVEPLLFFQSSTQDELTTLGEYVERMKPGQDAIFYITGESLDAVKSSPHLEAFAAKGYEVLYLTDPIDEIMVGHVTEFGDFPLKSVGKGEVELGTDEEKKAAEEAREQKQAEHKDLLEKLGNLLADHVKEVRLSSRLTTSAVCLVGGEHDLSPGLEKMLRQANQATPDTKRILELNGDHPLMGKLKALYAADGDDPKLGDYAKLLYGQALIAEGAAPPEPAEFARLVAGLMV